MNSNISSFINLSRVWEPSQSASWCRLNSLTFSCFSWKIKSPLLSVNEARVFFSISVLPFRSSCFKYVHTKAHICKILLLRKFWCFKHFLKPYQVWSDGKKQSYYTKNGQIKTQYMYETLSHSYRGLYQFWKQQKLSSRIEWKWKLWFKILSSLQSTCVQLFIILLIRL